MSEEGNKIKVYIFDAHEDIEKVESVNDISMDSPEESHFLDGLKEDDINPTARGIFEMKRNQSHSLIFLNPSCHSVKEFDQLCSRTSVAHVTLRHEESGTSSEVNINMVDIKEGREDKEKQVLRDIALMSLLETYGDSEKIFVSWLELKKMNIFFFNDLKYHFLQQKFPTKFLSTPVSTSYVGFYFLVTISFFLLFLSIFLFYFSTNFVQVQVPYNSTTSTASLDLSNVYGWKEKASVSIYADLQDFQSVYKSYKTSKASQELKDSCDDYQTFQCFKGLRDIKTVPEISRFTNLLDDTKVFPFGVLEYFYFNDYFDMIHSDSKQSVTLDTTHITTPHDLIFFFKKASWCEDKSSTFCWISPILPRFQSWMNTESYYTNRVLLAHVPDGLLRKKYSIVFTQNVWPSETLNVKKSLVFVQFSVLGTSQLIPCILCLCVGCITLILTFFFNYFKKSYA